MVNRIFKNQERVSVNYDGKFSGRVDKNTNKTANKTKVSFKKPLFKIDLIKLNFTSIYSLFALKHLKTLILYF